MPMKGDLLLIYLFFGIFCKFFFNGSKKTKNAISCAFFYKMAKKSL